MRVLLHLRGVLVRFIEETDFVERIADRGLPLVSVDLVIDRDFDRINRVCEVMAAARCEAFGDDRWLGAEGCRHERDR